MVILNSYFQQLPGEVRGSLDMHFEALNEIFQIRIYSISKFLAENGEKRALILLFLLNLTLYP